MKFRQLTYLLAVSSVICLALYFIGPFRDLWANLFASLIIILVFERILEHARMRERSENVEPSKKYVCYRISHVLKDLLFYSLPPSDWKSRLESGSDWNDYYQRLMDIRRKTLEELTSILVNPEYLLKDELRNGISVIVRILNSFDSMIIETRREGDIWRLYDAAKLSEIAIYQSIKVLKQNKLVNSGGLMFRTKKGEPTEIKFLESGTNIEHTNSVYKAWLNETIEFRDECDRRRMSTKASS